ncbi:helix-turn-helix domain-containing protein [Duganella sp. FT80W]|uniref:Helix-turn-helix domain-containing protein n=1 Tax=Duganella guangzhouensis TaxID=2666084 RepID=A0A6I2L5Y3_9BURK|nr:AraC family transcriptional regulator [Duganella guangzhouensis]MRW93203.1 helix-turn-helix domain-containing protein [Duganella guangzhouensis]
MNSLAYHVVVHALEGRAGWTPMSRFVATVAHVIDGHLPYLRYNAAGRARAAEGVTEGQIERAVREFLVTDLSVGVKTTSMLSSPEVVVAAYNAYNSSAKIAVRTSVSLPGDGHDARAVVAQRRMLVGAADPGPCREGTLAMFEGLLGLVEKSACLGAPPRRSLGTVAELLGVRNSAAAEASAIFEAEGSMSVGELARRLGCHQRALERKLKAEGVTAETLRQAARMLRAADRLGSGDSLTTIAVEEGYSDLSHMTRSFNTSSGMQPSMLRGLLRADAAAQTSRTQKSESR